MDIEKQIVKRMEDYGYTRLDAIASLTLGKRSKSAEIASANRARRKELMEHGMDFETACLVVTHENERALANERLLMGIPLLVHGLTNWIDI